MTRFQTLRCQILAGHGYPHYFPRPTTENPDPELALALQRIQTELDPVIFFKRYSTWVKIFYSALERSHYARDSIQQLITSMEPRFEQHFRRLSQFIVTQDPDLLDEIFQSRPVTGSTPFRDNYFFTTVTLNDDLILDSENLVTVISTFFPDWPLTDFTAAKQSWAAADTEKIPEPAVLSCHVVFGNDDDKLQEHLRRSFGFES